MTRVVFETASLADAVREAAIVAPTRGEAFDKAAGIVLEIRDGQCIVKATDHRLWYMQWITPLEIDGPPVRWRLSSKVFSDVVTKLPMTSATRFILESDRSSVKMVHGKKRGSFQLIPMDNYDLWPPFDPDSLTEVDQMAQRISQVEWAASAKINPPYSGIHFTGEAIVATDRQKFATAPLKVDGLKEPVTVPAGLLGRVIKSTDTPRVGADENQMLIMPDPHTQIAAAIFGVGYPPIERVMKRERPQYVKVNKAYLLDAMQVALAFAEGDRQPIMRTFWGMEAVAVMLQGTESGHLGDEIDVPGQADHPRVEVKFDPDYIMPALEHCQTTEITIGYDPGNLSKPLYINAGEGCEFWVAPTRGVPGADG